jgi:8-oxo-dGTP diphosphatase
VLIEVACGVLKDAQGRVLLAQRPAGKIAAGKWEFPGGKIESGEQASAALARELREELGIEVLGARPLIRVQHTYSDRRVLLDTWLIDRWTGEPRGVEAQALAWVEVERLREFDLLAADGPIVTALSLPPVYVFTPPDIRERDLLAGLGALPRDALLRLRFPGLDAAAYEARARRVLDAVRGGSLRIVLDRDAAMVERLGAHGWHLRARTSLRMPRTFAGLSIVSCHTLEEVTAARDWNADALVVGPVLPTATHPGVAPIGWSGFNQSAFAASRPVYAIGGLSPAGLNEAHRNGGQGVAGISAFWKL